MESTERSGIVISSVRLRFEIKSFILKIELHKQKIKIVYAKGYIRECVFTSASKRVSTGSLTEYTPWYNPKLFMLKKNLLE